MRGGQGTEWPPPCLARPAWQEGLRTAKLLGTAPGSLHAHRCPAHLSLARVAASSCSLLPWCHSQARQDTGRGGGCPGTLGDTAGLYVHPGLRGPKPTAWPAGGGRGPGPTWGRAGGLLLQALDGGKPGGRWRPQRPQRSSPSSRLTPGRSSSRHPLCLTAEIPRAAAAGPAEAVSKSRRHWYDTGSQPPRSCPRPADLTFWCLGLGTSSRSSRGGWGRSSEEHLEAGRTVLTTAGRGPLAPWLGPCPPCFPPLPGGLAHPGPGEAAGVTLTQKNAGGPGWRQHLTREEGSQVGNDRGLSRRGPWGDSVQPARRMGQPAKSSGTGAAVHVQHTHLPGPARCFGYLWVCSTRCAPGWAQPWGVWRPGLQPMGWVLLCSEQPGQRYWSIFPSTQGHGRSLADCVVGLKRKITAVLRTDAAAQLWPPRGQ